MLPPSSWLLPASWWFIACLTLLSWRCWQCVPPKRWINFNELNGVTSQETQLFIVNNVYKTSAFPVWPDLFLKSSRRSDSKACVYLGKWFADRYRYIDERKIFQGYLWHSPSYPHANFNFSQCTLLPEIRVSLPSICQIGRAIVQAVSRRLPTVAARVRSQVRSRGICGGQSGTGASVLRVLWFPLPILIPRIPSINHLAITQ
jgi:hypothetical protein